MFFISVLAFFWTRYVLCVTQLYTNTRSATDPRRGKICFVIKTMLSHDKKQTQLRLVCCCCYRSPSRAFLAEALKICTLITWNCFNHTSCPIISMFIVITVSVSMVTHHVTILSLTKVIFFSPPL